MKLLSLKLLTHHWDHWQWHHFHHEVGHGYERGHVKDGVLHDLHGYDVVEEVEVAHHTIVFDEHMDDNDENILLQ